MTVRGALARVGPRGRVRLGSDARYAYALNAPAAIAIALVVGVPIVSTFWFSLHNYRLAPPQFGFLGLENYVHAVTEPALIAALRFSVIFSALVVPAIVLTGLAAALLLTESFPGRGLVRTLMIIPWAIPGVVNGQLWNFIFSGSIGGLNGLLYSLGIITEYRSWLTDPGLALAVLVFAAMWNGVPVAAIIFLAALQAIPAELYEAARIDRAGIVQRFRHVTVPWLQHAILIVLILQTMVALRTYDLIYVMTGGGPGDTTTTIAWLANTTTFRFLNFGVGSTYSFILALFTFVLATIYFKILYARGDFRV